MTNAELHHLVDELPDDAVDRGAVLLKRVALWQPDSDQAWFWTPEWLDGELEADAEVAIGGGLVYESEADLIAALRAVRRA
ncbi:MAG: hypothetical protein ACR2PL_00975 [Dehalococcoidia bacterium]